MNALDQSIEERKKLLSCNSKDFTNISRKVLIKIKSTWRRQTKEEAHKLTLLYRGKTVTGSHQSYCIRTLFLKIVQYPMEKPVLESSFNKLADL